MSNYVFIPFPTEAEVDAGMFVAHPELLGRISTVFKEQAIKARDRFVVGQLMEIDFKCEHDALDALFKALQDKRLVVEPYRHIDQKIAQKQCFINGVKAGHGSSEAQIRDLADELNLLRTVRENGRSSFKRSAQESVWKVSFATKPDSGGGPAAENPPAPGA